MITTHPIFLPRSAQLKDEEYKEHNEILKKIILNLYPNYPTVENFKVFFEPRRTCKKFDSVYKDFFPNKMSVEKKKRQEFVKERSRLMAKLDLCFSFSIGNFREAIVRGKVIDLPDSNSRAQWKKKGFPFIQLHQNLKMLGIVQTTLISLMGFEGALDITKELDEETRTFALVPYFQIGCDKCISSSNISSRELHQVACHPFIQALLKKPKTSLSQPAAEYFLQHVINRGLGISSFDAKTQSVHSDSSEEAVEEEMPPEEIPEYLEKRFIVRKWLLPIISEFPLEKLCGGEDLTDYLTRLPDKV